VVAVTRGDTREEKTSWKGQKGLHDVPPMEWWSVSMLIHAKNLQPRQWRGRPASRLRETRLEQVVFWRRSKEVGEREKIEETRGRPIRD